MCENALSQFGFIPTAATNKWSAPKVKGTPPTKRDFHSACAVGPDGKVGLHLRLLPEQRSSSHSPPLHSLSKCILVFGGAQEIESKDIFIHYNDVYLLDTGWLAETAGFQHEGGGGLG